MDFEADDEGRRGVATPVATTTATSTTTSTTSLVDGQSARSMNPNTTTTFDVGDDDDDDEHDGGSVTLGANKQRHRKKRGKEEEAEIRYHYIPQNRYIPSQDPAHEEQNQSFMNFKFPEKSSTPLPQHQRRGPAAKDPTAFMSLVAQCERNPIVFHGTSTATPKHDTGSHDKNDSGDDSSAELRLSNTEMKNLAADRRRQAEALQDRPLLTAKLREKDRLERLKKRGAVDTIVVRFLFSDKTTLQATFLPSEPVASAYGTLKDLLRDDVFNKLFLFTTPPRKLYPRTDTTTTFADTSTAACLLFRLGCEGRNGLTGKDALLPDVFASTRQEQELSTQLRTPILTAIPGKDPSLLGDHSSSNGANNATTETADVSTETPEEKRQKRLEAIKRRLEAEKRKKRSANKQARLEALMMGNMLKK